MTYPEAEDYIRAVQQPERSFLRPDLRSATFDVHPVFQIPMPASGNAAVVFKAQVEGSDTALRFFIREDASSRERYAALGRHFADYDIEDCVAHPTWVDGAISLNDASWPIVLMTWVDGRTLDAYVGHLASIGDVGALHSLAATWRGLVERLQDADFAHGDLQHGNVLVDTSSSLRLVDFDGSWIASFADGPPPRETGHPNYQRTGREWGRWMDTFPGLVVYTALLTLSRRPASWAQLHSGENILFSAEDFAPPFGTRAWQIVDGVQDAEVERAAERLKQACSSGWRASDTLESLLVARPRIDVQPPRTTPAALRYSGVNLHGNATPWWQQTGVPPSPEYAGAVAGGRANDAATGPPAGRRLMPPPPPKTRPGMSGTGGTRQEPPSFTRSTASGIWYTPTSGPSRPPGQPPSSGKSPLLGRPPAGDRRSVGEVLSVLILIVGITALFAGSVVGAAGGSGAVAALVSALAAAVLTLPVLLRRKPRRSRNRSRP